MKAFLVLIVAVYFVSAFKVHNSLKPIVSTIDYVYLPQGKISKRTATVSTLFPLYNTGIAISLVIDDFLNFFDNTLWKEN